MSENTSWSARRVALRAVLASMAGVAVVWASGSTAAPVVVSGSPDITIDRSGTTIELLGSVLLSFDLGGTLGGVSVADEDVLRYDPGTNTWLLAIDASTADPDWGASDLDALHVVPEPGLHTALALGLATLGTFVRHRARFEMHTRRA